MTLDLPLSFSQREAENTATHLLNNAKIFTTMVIQVIKSDIYFFTLRGVEETFGSKIPKYEEKNEKPRKNRGFVRSCNDFFKTHDGLNKNVQLGRVKG